MGCDIHGWIEIKPFSDSGWEPAVRLSVVLGRNYAVFGLLFGVRNATGLLPLAPRRGLPPDVSRVVQAEAAAWEDDGHSHSSVTLAELDAYDWEQAGHVERLHQYGQDAAGAWAYELPCGAGGFDAAERAALDRGETVERQGKRYRWERVQAKHLRVGELDRLMALMRLLAEWCSPPETPEHEPAAERVRVVVWFDN